MRIAGYAAIFDAPDHGGDVVRKGAFAQSLARRAVPVPLYWQHDPQRIAGRIERIEEDGRGLRVIARLDGRARVMRGQGLSFGYRVKASRPGHHRELTAVELIEVSLVSSPMQPLARVIAVEG